MKELPFIFSNKPKYRIGRHVLFWLIAFFGPALVGVEVLSIFNQSSKERFLEATVVQFLYLPAQIFLAYIIMYYVIPQFILKNKYFKAFLLVIALFLSSGIISAFTYALFVDPIMQFFMGVSADKTPNSTFDAMFATGFIFGMRSSLGVAGFAASIKLMKHWYENQYRASILEKEKINAELLSLKAQLHPHFLFNTLNNIYSSIQNVSPKASKMLSKLSELLRYIIYECNSPCVPLSSELKIIKSYIDLESIRYDKSLDVNIYISGDTSSYCIAPLLLLPLIENSFKHGTSKVIEQPWIKLEASIKNNIFSFILINGKMESKEINGFQHGVGLQNVIKRLEFIYPEKHEIKVVSESEIFIVNLSLELEHI